MNRFRRAVLACAFALPLLIAGGASAQSVSASMNPQATIALAPVTGGGVRNLSFGALTVGGTANTGPGAEANAGTAKWEFGGLVKNAPVTLTFGLPTLTKGTSTLPVDWTNTGYGLWCSRRATDAPGTCTTTGTFDPGTAGASATTASGTGNNDRVLTVWIGATVTTLPANMTPGLYTGTLSLTITVN